MEQIEMNPSLPAINSDACQAHRLSLLNLSVSQIVFQSDAAGEGFWFRAQTSAN